MEAQGLLHEQYGIDFAIFVLGKHMTQLRSMMFLAIASAIL